MKKLCIVSNVIGNRDVIHNEENGYVCKTVNEFVASIRKAKMSQGLVNRAYEEVMNKYTTDIMAQSYKRIYTEEIMRGGVQNRLVPSHNQYFSTTASKKAVV